MKKITYIFLLMLLNVKVYSQADVTNHVGSSGAFYLGWDNSALSNALHLNIEHKGTRDINFLTGGTQRMTIQGTAAANPGFVGIGNGLTPGWQLDVNSEINITNPTFAGGTGSYMLGSNTILASPGTNLMVGIGAGVNNAAGNDNTFVGTNAGQSNILSSGNTFLGCKAGGGMPDINNAIAIGANTKVNCNNCTVIGGEKIGICTTEPQATLDVNGTIQAKQIVILEKGNAKDLLDMISELQNEVAELKQQITALAKN